MADKKWVVLGLGIIGIVAAIAFGLGNWPARAFRPDMFQAGLAVAGGLLVISLFLERAMAVVNSLLFSDESIDLKNRARLQLLSADRQILETEYAQKRLEESRQRVRLAGSFLIAILIAVSGVNALDGLMVPAAATETNGSTFIQADLFRILDILLTAGVLAGGSSGIAAIIDLLRQNVDAQKESALTRQKAAMIGENQLILSERYQRAGFALQAANPPSSPPADPFFGLNTDTEADDAAAYREWMSGAAETADMKLMALSAAKNWRVASALEKLRDQLNAAYPGRRKSSDGTIGDTRHCPGKSDHCPNIQDGDQWVVTAFDATDDPASGCDMDSVTEAIIQAQDPRIKYIIWNRRICSSYPHSGQPAWVWRPYSGANPHDKHAHFSVKAEKHLYDDDSDWSIA